MQYQNSQAQVLSLCLDNGPQTLHCEESMPVVGVGGQVCIEK